MRLQKVAGTSTLESPVLISVLLILISFFCCVYVFSENISLNISSDKKTRKTELLLRSCPLPLPCNLAESNYYWFQLNQRSKFTAKQKFDRTLLSGWHDLLYNNHVKRQDLTSLQPTLAIQFRWLRRDNRPVCVFMLVHELLCSSPSQPNATMSQQNNFYVQIQIRYSTSIFGQGFDESILEMAHWLRGKKGR